MHHIRVLEPKDSSRYRAIRLEALKVYPEHFGSGYEQQLKLEKLYFERLIEENSSKGKMFGTFVDGELVGICGITFETQVLPDAGEIIQMYVKPDYQNLGLGKKLMRTVESECAGGPVCTLLLEVFKSNHQAILVYESSGYRVDENLGDNSGTQYMVLKVIQ